MLTYFSIIIITIIYNFINFFFFKNIFSTSLFIFRKNHYYKTWFIFSFFMCFFVVGYRFLNLFVSKASYISIIEVYNFFSFFNFCYVYIFFLVAMFARRVLFLIFRISFLRLHYFTFMRYQKYESFFFILCNAKVRFFIFLGSNKKLYFIIYFLLNNFFKFIFLFFLFRSIFFGNFMMYIGFFPYYAFYYFLFNCFNFLENFEPSFDQGILKFYYPDFFCITAFGFAKLDLYMRKLVYGNSEFFFVNCLIYDYNKNYPQGWIFFEKINYSNVSQLNSVLILNKKFLPKLIG